MLHNPPDNLSHGQYPRSVAARKRRIRSSGMTEQHFIDLVRDHPASVATEDGEVCIPEVVALTILWKHIRPSQDLPEGSSSFRPFPWRDADRDMVMMRGGDRMKVGRVVRS